MQDEKYIVFKREVFDQFLVNCSIPALSPQMGERLNDLLTNGLVEDAVVIRTGDEIAPPVLDLYSSMYRVLADYMKTDGMIAAADYFHQRAVEAWERDDRKLPD